MKEQFFVIQYRKGSISRTSAPMKCTLVEKHAQLLADNGYQVEIKEYPL